VHLLLPTIHFTFPRSGFVCFAVLRLLFVIVGLYSDLIVDSVAGPLLLLVVLTFVRSVVVTLRYILLPFVGPLC